VKVLPLQFPEVDFFETVIIDNIYGAVIMSQPLQEFTQHYLMNAEQRRAAANL